MCAKHRIDRVKLFEELHKRGWHPNAYGAIETVDGKSDKEASEDYFASIEASIICEADQPKGDIDVQYNRTKRN